MARAVAFDREAAKQVGDAWYSLDGTELLGYEGKSESFEIAPGCRRIAPKAFGYHSELRHVIFPEGLEEIQTLAFVDSGIEHVELPASVRSIGEKAFMRCKRLEAVSLNEGLLELGQSAFESTKIEHMEIPTTLREFGRNVAYGTPLAANPAGVISFEGNPAYCIDDCRCIYRRTEEGLFLWDGTLVTEEVFRPLPDTVELAPWAFALNRFINRVELCESVRVVRANAFNGCFNLSEIVFPEGLETLEGHVVERASVRRVHLPKSLVSFDDAALTGTVESMSNLTTTLERITVDPENPRFYIETGLLCEILPDGTHKGLMFAGGTDTVWVPRKVAKLGSCAFTRAQNLRELHFWESLRYDTQSTFATIEPIARVYVHFEEPRDGHECICATFPQQTNSYQHYMAGFQGYTVDVKLLMECSDNFLLFDPELLRKWRRGIERMMDPYLLDESTENSLNKQLKRYCADIVTMLAEGHFWEDIDSMVQLGYLNAERFDEAMQAVSELNDVEATAFMMELKHRSFGESRFNEDDFDW